jgi:hypothetical protein
LATGCIYHELIVRGTAAVRLSDGGCGQLPSVVRMTGSPAGRVAGSRPNAQLHPDM